MSGRRAVGQRTSLSTQQVSIQQDQSAVFGPMRVMAARPDGEAADCLTIQFNNTLWQLWLHMRAALPATVVVAVINNLGQ
jgi:hypothetical protein